MVLVGGANICAGCGGVPLGDGLLVGGAMGVATGRAPPLTLDSDLQVIMDNMINYYYIFFDAI